MIGFVDKASANATSVTLPTTTIIGDIIIIFAYRAALTAPSLPAGYTSISTQSANSNSFRIGWARAAGGDTSGTWTNADIVIAAIYRGVLGIGGAGSTTNASAATVTISGIGAFTIATGSSWVVSYAGSIQTTSTATPSSTTLRSSQTGATMMAILADSASGQKTWAQRTPAIGTNAVGAGGSFELIMDSNIAINNYQFFDVGNGMSTTEKIK